MNVSEKGIQFIKSREALRLQAYLDDGGVPTIGYGHTKGVKLGDTCTFAEALGFLNQDLSPVIAALNQDIVAPVNQNQFDALTALTFNIGIHAFHNSTLLRLLNDHNYAQAALEFPKWDHDNGKVVPGLLARRLMEKAIFESLA